MKSKPVVDRALHLLGIRNFLLGIHDAAFPGLPTEDVGRGSPYTDGAAAFFEFAASLGFNGVQLGPQGITTPTNASPYDGSFFSRNPLSLALLPLTRSECPLLDPEQLARIIGQRPGDKGRVDDRFAGWAQEQIGAEVCTRMRQVIKSGHCPACTALLQAYDAFRQNRGRLDSDALYQVLRRQYGGKTWKQWADGSDARLDRHLFAPEKNREAQTLGHRLDLCRRHGQAIDDYCFIQFLLAEQHRQLRTHCRNLGLKLFGDFQIGMSGRDSWYAQSFLLPGYVMGAPPSRTNPQGQPWNYSVLDPRCYYAMGRNGTIELGPALHFVRQRLEKMAGEFDGLRLDHPHGLICPWVYKEGQPDPLSAVQNGSRLFASPNESDHPALADLAIVRPEQLNRRLPRYADDWVADLTPEQLSRYGRLFAVIMDTLKGKRRGPGEIACEILSTQPYPVKRVLQLYGLGQLRVTQKVDLTNPGDVYRSENAQRPDWLMFGNHDTDPIWKVVDTWADNGTIRGHAEYLATRLAIPEAERTHWIERHAQDPAALVQAKFAELFLGPGQNVMVYFVDLLGGKKPYNRPGTVSKDNWSLRITPDYKKSYREGLSTNRVLNIPQALAMALQAKVNSGGSIGAEHHELIRRLGGVKQAF